MNGRVLRDQAWLSARIAQLGSAWGADTTRVAGTLWWYMLASALIDPVVRAYVERRPAPLLTPERVRFDVRADGAIDRVEVREDSSALEYGHALIDGDDHAAEQVRALRATLTEIITALAAASGTGIATLWAITTDAIGNRALAAGDHTAAWRLSADLDGAVLTPRFIEVGGNRFVRRVSCCAIYRIPACSLCTSCPKRPAAERESLLRRSAAAG